MGVREGGGGVRREDFLGGFGGELYLMRHMLFGIREPRLVWRLVV